MKCFRLALFPMNFVFAVKLKGVLNDFAVSTGLRINFQKSNLIPINISAEKASDLANVFACTVGSLPFTYLGLPLGTTKPTMTEFMPLIDRVERRISNTTALMCHG